MDNTQVITISENDSPNERTISVKESPIKCKGCEKDLGVLLVSDKPVKSGLSKKRFDCPCGDSSFIMKTSTESFILLNEELEYDNFFLERDTMISVAKLRRKNNNG